MPTVSGDELTISIAGVVTRRFLLASRLRYLPPKERTQVLELCLARAWEWWIATYLPLRFNPGYARRELGYQIKEKTRRIKAHAARTNPDAILPNVRSGETRRDVLASTRVITKAVGGARSAQVKANITMRMPGYITQAYSLTGNIMAKITIAEGEKICARFAEEVVAISQRFTMAAVDTRDGQFENRATIGAYDAGQLGRTNRATITAQRASMAQEARGA